MSKKNYSVAQIEKWFANLPAERKQQIFNECFEFPHDLDFLKDEQADN